VEIPTKVRYIWINYPILTVHGIHWAKDPHMFKQFAKVLYLSFMRLGHPSPTPRDLHTFLHHNNSYQHLWKVPTMATSRNINDSFTN
jgi:hypothetical protein